MEWIVFAAVVIGFFWFRANKRAHQIIERRAHDLARHSDRSAESIAAEMKHRRISPGDWAREHGLDPMTLEPTAPRTDANGLTFDDARKLLREEVEHRMEERQRQLDAVEQRIAEIDNRLDNFLTEQLLPSEIEELKAERQRLEEERVQLERLLRLAPGGDRKDEPSPE